MITTPNGKEHKAKDNSWHVLHFNNSDIKWYAHLNPKRYTTDKGKTRWKAELPVLLSITSTDANEVLMGIFDVLRCFNITYSKHRSVQLFLDGQEIIHPANRSRLPDHDHLSPLENSWFLLSIKKEHAEEYDNLDLQEYQLTDGRLRYNAKLPMLCKTLSTGASEIILDIEAACKYFHVPTYLYERFEMFVDGKLSEHPSNIISVSSHVLPCGVYYVGDPILLNSDTRTFRNTIPHNRLDSVFTLNKHKILSISTHSDDSFPLYKISKNVVNHFDSIITETATIAFVPIDMLCEMGFTKAKIKRDGFVFDSASYFTCSENKSFPVQITYKGGLPQCVDFLDYAILIGDKGKYED